MACILLQISLLPDFLYLVFLQSILKMKHEEVLGRRKLIHNLFFFFFPASAQILNLLRINSLKREFCAFTPTSLAVYNFAFDLISWSFHFVILTLCEFFFFSGGNRKADNVPDCVGFVWQGWGWGQSRLRGGFCEKLPPCLTETVPADSKTEPPLAKAKHISDTSSISGITCLGREKKCWATTAGKRSVDM